VDTIAGRHFPGDPTGAYIGYHPADSDGALLALEEARAAGAEFLVLPRDSYWWFGHYAAFADALRRSFPVVASDEDTCTIFALRRAADLTGEVQVGAPPTALEGA
jgi:hypothetical protein